jgi:asparagine synthase (glutamine-hydrolysing)
MCGICGVMRVSGSRAIEADTVVRMRDAMVHRGPDDAGVYVSPDRRVGMGHRRLAIVDLSASGRGPMCNEDGTIWISYNGEVYNHAALREPLERAGHVYRSRTDTETLLHLYEEHGPSMLEYLRGIFAFSLWDENTSRLLLARDRVGVKPVYFTVASGVLCWASEIKGLLAHPQVSAELDEEALGQYLTFATVPPPSTLFAGIHKLPAGHMLVVEADGSMQISRWWSPGGHSLPEGLAAADENEKADYLRSLLTSAVTEQTMADVPHGVLLSGGVDSSLILSILSSALDKPVRTFSVGFDGQPRFDERAYAASAARQFGAEHHELVLQPHHVRGSLSELVYAQDEPISDWACVPMMLLAQSVRQHGVIVVQVGEGSDELFAGYPRYKRYAKLDPLWRSYGTLPSGVRASVNAITRSVLPGWKRLREPRDLFRRAARGEPLFVSGAVVNWDDEKDDLLTHGARKRLPERSSSQVALRNLRRFRSESPAGDFVSAMAYQDLMVRLPELLLMRVDKMTMRNSIEARVPFLDHRIVEFGMALSADFKLRGGRTKHILKVAAAPLLGAEFINRRKMGFDVPLAGWLRAEPLASWAEDAVLQSQLMRRDLFDAAFVRQLFRQHRAGVRDHGHRIWNLVNCCTWYDRWVCRRAA